MKSEIDEGKIIKYFESRIRRHKKSPDRELWLNDLEVLRKVLKSVLSNDTNYYLKTIIKDSLKQ